MKKRLLSLALALLMVLSMLPVTALATHHTSPPAPPTWDDVKKDTKKFNKLKFEVECDTNDDHDADDIMLNSLEDTVYTVSEPTKADKDGEKYKFTVELKNPASYCDKKADGFTHTVTKSEPLIITVKYDDHDKKWEIKEGDGGEYDCKCTPTQETHTLKYNLNGGSGSFSDQTWTGNADSHTFKISSDRPTLTHYNFLGWADSADAAAASYQPDVDITVSGTKTIYAVWGRSACYDNDTDGFCDGCNACMHDHDTDGFCTEEDCTHGNTCCPKPQPPTPPTPDMDSLPNAIGAVKVKVVCASDTSHTSREYAVGTYTRGEVSSNQVTVTISEPTSYVTSYNTDTTTSHTYDAEHTSNKLTFIMEWALNTDGTAYAWKLNGNQPQVMAKCESEPPVDPPTTVTVDLGNYIQKTLTNATGSTFSGSETFTVTVTEGVAVVARDLNNNPLPATTTYTGTVTMTAAGTKKFVFANGGNALALGMGTHTFTVKETKGSATGITYDETSYTLSIKVTPNSDGTGLSVEANPVTVTNTYTQPQPPQPTTFPVYFYAQTVDKNRNPVPLNDSDLARIGLAYNDTTKIWVTLGEVKNLSDYSTSAAEAALNTPANFTAHTTNTKNFPLNKVHDFQLQFCANSAHIGYSAEGQSYDAYHLNGEITFYYITFDRNTADNVDGMPTGGYFYDGEKIILPAPTRTGYTFTGWSDGTNSYNANSEYTVTDNATLTAQWQALPVYVYAHTVNSAGEEITVDEAVRTRLHFNYNSSTKQYWFTLGALATEQTLTKTAYATTDAEFAAVVAEVGTEKLTRTHNPNAPLSAVEFNELKLVRAKGHNGFSSDNKDSNGYWNAYHLNGDLTFYSVTFDANAGTDTVGGTVPANGLYYKGEKITLPALTRTGYTFTGWSDGTNSYNENSEYTVTDNATLTAQWAVRTDLTCIVRYVKKGTTTPVHEPTTVTGLTYGEPYTATALSISGYRLYGDREQTITVGLENEIVFEYTRKSSSSSSSSSKPSSSGSTLKFNTRDHDAYIKGYPDGTVKPYGSITRAEVATILYRIMDDDCVERYYTTRNRFYDVDSSKWYNTYVSTLANAGVIVDSNNGYFRPDEAITRAELAVMIAQFASTSTSNTSRFTDVFSTHWAYQEIGIAEKLGWIAGYPDGSFRPDATITRAEMVTMVNRALNRLPSSEERLLSRARMVTFPDCEPDDWFYLAIQEAANGHTYRSIGKYGDEEWIALTK